VSYRVLRGRWRSIFVLDVHVRSEEKSDNSKDRPYEELEQVLHNFRKYNMKILLGVLLKKLGQMIFSNRQLGMIFYIRIVMIMILE
jgi:hypothetical protein